MRVQTEQAVVRVVAPEQVGRAHHEITETERDVRVLGWISRFRFVTCEELGAWSRVSVQQARSRVRRLAKAGLLEYRRLRSGDPWLVYVSNRGNRLLGLPRRFAPRVDVQLEHEHAIVALCTALEHGGEQVLTERQCRRLERIGKGHFSVEVPQSQRNETRRWPDLVIDREDGLVAIEIELNPKTTDRLRRIVSGYGRSRYTEVVWHTHGQALAQRIGSLIQRECDIVTWRDVVPMRVQASRGADDPGGAAAGDRS